MTATVQWRPGAIEDLARIVSHIAEENSIAARHVGRELLLSAESLQLFPRRGRPGLVKGTHELVSYHPYILVYRVTGNNVSILRVWHAAQLR